MKISLNLFFTIGLILGYSTLVAQTKDLLPEASRELVTTIEHDTFTLILERFEDDGVPNLSMSKGFEFIRIGSDLGSILNTLWPKHNFNISPEIKKHNYHLMLQHLDQKRTEEFLEMVLGEFLAASGFNIQLNHEIQIHNCVEVESIEKLSQNYYVPDRGVIRSTTYKGEELTLSGYTLEDIMSEISNIYGSIFSLNHHDLPHHTYEMSFDMTDSGSIQESLRGYGFSISECEREVEVIYIE